MQVLTCSKCGATSQSERSIPACPSCGAKGDAVVASVQSVAGNSVKEDSFVIQERVK